MTGGEVAIHVVETDLMRGDVLVHFSDGTTTLFLGSFLYEVRTHDGNVRVAESSDDDEPDAAAPQEK